MANSGEAYGFLKYKGRREDLAKYLPQARDRASPDLAVKLTTLGSLDTKGDTGLEKYVQLVRGYDFNYAIKATIPGKTNGETAKELHDVLLQLCQTPAYKTGDDFFCEIAYHNGVEYDDYVK